MHPADIEQYGGQDVMARFGIPAIKLAGPVCIGGTGRRRVFLPVPLAEELDSIDIAPDVVLNICRSLKINGVVLFARLNASRLRCRVFTTSLGGHEDAATGGAVLGLSDYDRCFKLGLENVIQVDQGRLGAANRGTFFLRREMDAGPVWLGGRADVLVSGCLRAESAPDAAQDE